MPEYVPSAPQPPCPQPVQGCTCIPGLLSVACLPMCLQRMFRVQAAVQYGQPLLQYSGQPANPLFNGGPGAQSSFQPASGQPSSDTRYASWSYGLSSINQPSELESAPSLQPVSSQYGANHPALFSGQFMNPLPGSYGSANPPSLFSGQISNQPYLGSYPQYSAVYQQYPGGYAPPNAIQPGLHSDSTLNLHYPVYGGDVQNQPSPFPGQGSPFSAGLNLNLPSYNSPNLNQPKYPGIKRSLGDIFKSKPKTTDK